MKRRAFLQGLFVVGALAGMRVRIPEFQPTNNDDSWCGLTDETLSHLRTASAESLRYTKESVAANMLNDFRTDNLRLKTTERWAQANWQAIYGSSA